MNFRAGLGPSSLRGGFLRGEAGRHWLSGLLGQGTLFPGCKFSEHLRSGWANGPSSPLPPAIANDVVLEHGHTHSFTYSKALSVLKWQSCRIVTEAVWSPKPNIFTI